MTEIDASQGERGSPFWRFSLRFYAMDGVAPACIALQDEGGIDVNVLLYLLWNASCGRCLSADDVALVEQASAPWRENIVVPLRHVRRALKTPPDLVAPAAAAAYRERIKATELEAERLQQEALFAMTERLVLTERAAVPIEAARDNIAAYQALHDSAFPPRPLETISAAFSSFIR